MGIENDSMMANARHKCPEAEQLAAYLDGSVTGDARRDIEEHASECEECRSVLSEAAEYRLAAAKAAIGSRDRFGGRPWFLAAGLLATAAVVLLAVRLFVWGPGQPHGDGEGRTQWLTLVAAMDREPARPVDGRLSGFAYAPPPSIHRGGSDRQASPEVRIAAAAVETEAAGRVSPAQRRELGVAFLAVGDLDRAIAALETAINRMPDADAYNDLSAAYFTRAMRTGRASDLTNALTAARRARQLRPDSQAAWFNEALILDDAGRRDEAQAAMAAYLKLDATSAWARELRERLSR